MIAALTIRSIDQSAWRSLEFAMAGTGRKVVVVEDDDSMRGAIDRLLDAAGFECAAYASAEAYLAASPGEGAACVVSDLKLPAISGLDLLAALRARAASGRR
ncbi:MAG: response regulator [Comamonadaceae bacterium]|nr:response regulator [Comamonadaceae bacterium]